MKRQKRPREIARLAFLAPAPGMAVAAGPVVDQPVRGARRIKPRGDRYALLGRVRGKRWGELPAAPPAGRHTSPMRFVTEAAARTTSGPSHRPGVVIIAPASDLVAQLVATSLMYRHVPTCQLEADDLESVELEMTATGVSVNGHPISGLLWRAPTTANLDPLTSASWLAAATRLNAVNSYDPDAWRRGAGWSVWEDRLGECGVPVRPPYESDPTSPGTASLIACGTVVSGPDSESVAATAAVLEDAGVRLASVTTLPDGRVCHVDAQPNVTSIEARRAATRIADYVAA